MTDRSTTQRPTPERTAPERPTPERTAGERTAGERTVLERATTSSAAGADRAAGGRLDTLAPLTPNAWLRFDLIGRMLPDGIRDVLEIGCGQGALGARLALRYRYLGVEPDPESYAVAARRMAGVGGTGEIRNATVETLDARGFDLICAFEVLEHIEDDAAAVTGWAARLRPGGWLMLSVPAHQRRFGPADHMAGHFRRYDPDVMTALLARCGFSDIEVREYGTPLGYLLEAARNAVGRRRKARLGSMSVQERTAGSGRLLQPSGGAYGVAARWGTAPFRIVQRAFPRTGTGLVVRARLAAGTPAEGA